MNIVIIGCGKVGLTLAAQLAQENHAITLVDTDADRVNDAVNNLDVQGVLGNGTSYGTLLEAGVPTADLVIAVTDHDEQNLLCCLLARKTGRCQTIARVRNPGYYQDIRLIKDDLGLAMVINPELAAAEDISHLLQIPSALDIDYFAKAKVNMMRFRVAADSPLVGKNMMEINAMLDSRMLVCIRERHGEIDIPSGTTDLQAGDSISVIIPVQQIHAVLHKLKLQNRQVHSALIAGGGSISVYLARMLERGRVRTKIIESDAARCRELSELLPNVSIIHGDTTDKQLLLEEGLPAAESFIALTGLDEENIMLALYAEKVSRAKVVTKIGRIDFEEVISDLPLGSVVYPKNITAENIVRFVRALGNASGNNVETLYQILDGRVEALEFVVKPGSEAVVGIPLMKLPLLKGLLVCSINRGGRVIIPSGRDTIEEGDIVVIVTTHKGIRDLGDILRS